MSRRYTLTVRRDGRTVLRLRLPSLSAAILSARLYAAEGISVRIRPAYNAKGA